MNTVASTPAAKTTASIQTTNSSAGEAAATSDEGGDFAGLLEARIAPDTAERDLTTAPSGELIDSALDAATTPGDEFLVVDPGALLASIGAGIVVQNKGDAPSGDSGQGRAPAGLVPGTATTLPGRIDTVPWPVTEESNAPGASGQNRAGTILPDNAAHRNRAGLQAADVQQGRQRSSPENIATASVRELMSATNIVAAEARETAPVERVTHLATALSAATGAPGHAPAPPQSVNAANAALHVEQLLQPFDSPAWDDGLSGQVLWMARNGVRSAEIHLNPAELGPIEVKLSLTSEPGTPGSASGPQSSASVQFSAAHAATREAIESALPRLREMLAENGIALGNTTVDARNAGSSHESGHSGRSSQGRNQSATGHAETAQPGNEPVLRSPLRGGSGLLDTFA